MVRHRPPDGYWQWLRRGLSWRHGMAVALAAFVYVQPVLAQTQGTANGLCTLPAAGTVLPTGTLLLRGTLFLGGGYMAATASGQSGDGDYGSSSKRVGILVAVGVMAVGVLFPELMTWLLNLFGSSAADMGVGCAW